MTQLAGPGIDIYKLYKPLRNQLRTLNLEGLLTLITQVARDPLMSAVLKVRNPHGQLFDVYSWELHLIAREALLHAPLDQTKKWPDTRHLLELVSHLRRISEGISREKINSSADAAQALHPLIHQQARWQHARDWDRFYRVYRIYNRDNVRPLLEAAVGMRLNTINTLTFAIAGFAHRWPAIISNQDYSSVGVSDEERDAYFSLFGAPLADLHDAIKQRARYDESWAFTWNPFESTPLIQLRADRPHEYLCPVPQLLLRRATESLFFDLGSSGAKFDNPYGQAFQDYVGDVLRAQFKRPEHSVIEEHRYWVNKNQKHGVDWIVSDSSGHVMIECKTRRLKVDAKAIVDGELLTTALDELAAIVVQHYKNVRDALDGKTHWKPDGRPVFPFIVTFEDWYLFAPHVVERLHDLVHERLTRLGHAVMLESFPFIVTSIAEFEMAGQAIALIGIDKFCANRVASANRHFSLATHAQYAFPETQVTHERLFENGAKELFGHLSHLMDLPGPEHR